MARLLSITSFAFDRSIDAALAKSDSGAAGMDAAFYECKATAASVFAEHFADFSSVVGGEVEALEADGHCDPRIRRGLSKLLDDIEKQADELRRHVPRNDRLSRVSVSESCFAGVKADLHLQPGVTREMINFYCRAFRSYFREFVDVTIPLYGPDDDPFMKSTEDPFGTLAGPPMDDPFGEDPFGTPGSADPGPDSLDGGPESPSPPKAEGLFDDPFSNVPSASDGRAT